MKIGWIGLAVVLLGCGSKPASKTQADAAGTGAADTAGASAAGAPGAEKGVDVAALFERELNDLPPAADVSGSGWKAKVSGVAPKVEAGNQKLEDLTIPIGTKAPVSCIVFPEGIDPAVSIGRMLEQMDKKIQRVAVKPGPLVVEQETPVYFLTSMYLVDSPEGRLAGQVKLGVAARQARPFICVHDEAGYEKTFQRVVRGFAASMRAEGEKSLLAVSVSVARVGDVPIGFSRSWRERTPKGERVSVTMDSMLLPVSKTALSVSDDASRVVSSGDQIQEGLWIKSDERGVSLQVTLKLGKDARYTVEGNVKGKPVSGTIAAPKGGIPSEQARAARIARELAKGTPFRFSQKEYSPGRDPLGLVDRTYEHKASDEPRVVVGSDGQTQIKGKVNAHGELIYAEMPIGSETLIIEQVYGRDDEKKTR